LVAPPEDWQRPFEALAEECGLQTDIVEVFESVHEFFVRTLADATEQ
jgi:hypothetical protein